MASDDKKLLEVPVEGEGNGDDYTASIELSNACREFYRNRVEATQTFKQSMGSRLDNQVEVKKRTTIDDAMNKLRHEMASLMDQDLSLMKQLLTLNEAIEDLKAKRLYHVSKDSLRASSHELLNASDWSVSETDMFDSEDDLNKKHTDMNERISTGSISVPVTSSLTSIKSDIRRNSNISRTSDITLLVNGTPVTVHHGQQSSLDSGYGDEESFTKIYRGPMEVNL